VETILSMPAGSSVTMDASDALAVALCHVHRGGDTQKAHSKNWAAFIKENPGRVR